MIHECEPWQFDEDGRFCRACGQPLVDLYHRTTEEAARAIMQERRMLSKENNAAAFFSTRRDGHGTGYGDAVVHIRVPQFMIELDDEFPDGEQHYSVKVILLRPEHFIIDQE